MFGLFRKWVERVLKIPPPPSAPRGDEGTARVFRASPMYYRYRLVLFAGKQLMALLSLALFLAFALGSFSQVDEQLGEELGSIGTSVIIVFAVGSFLFNFAFSYAVLRLDYEKRWYLVTSRSLRIREGVLHVKEMTITYANIQNISISQGPLQRLLGISDLRVDTAGGSVLEGHRRGAHQNLHSAYFQGVDNAERIRELMQDRLRHLSDAGLGDSDDVAHELPQPQPGDLIRLLQEIHGEARAMRHAISGRG